MIDVCIAFTNSEITFTILLAVVAVLTVGLGGGYLVANLGPGPEMV